MTERKEQHKKSIRFFNDREVRAVWDKNTISGGSLYWTSLLRLMSKMITKRRETIGSNQRIGNSHQTMRAVNG